jgi:hypothetical protein
MLEEINPAQDVEQGREAFDLTTSEPTCLPFIPRAKH